jgi:hypothetical protein
LEILALRQQLAVLVTRHHKPRLALPDQMFWTILRQLWSGWKQALFIFEPETVVHNTFPLRSERVIGNSSV